MKELIWIILVIVFAKLGVDAWQSIPAAVAQYDQQRRAEDFERSNAAWREQFPQAAKEIDRP